VTGAVGSVTGAVGSVTGNVGGNVTGSVGSIATGGIVAASFAVDSITSGALSNGAADEIADHIWDEVLSGHLTAGTTGAALNSATSAADPWSTALPGAYGSGTAGNIVGNRLDVAVSTRLATSGYTAPTAAQITAAIKAMTLAENAQGTPAAAPTFEALLMWLYMEWRNLSTADSDSREIRNDADLVVAKATLSDAGGTFSKSKFVSGP